MKYSAIYGALLGVILSLWAITAAWGAWVVPLVPEGEWKGLILLGLGVVFAFLGAGVVALFVAAMGFLFAYIAHNVFGSK